MAVEAEIVQDGHPSDVFQVDAGSDRTTGEIVQIAGRAGVVKGHNPDQLKSGEKIAVDTGAIVRIPSVEGSTTFSAGDQVDWDDTGNEAVADGAAASDFDLGLAVIGTSAGGDALPQVKLNG